MSENNGKPIAGLGMFKERQNKTSRPEKQEPKVSEQKHRTLPDDQILVKPRRKLTQKDTPKSVQAQLDTHAALKQIATIENKRMYEVLNEVVEKYIQDMPNQSKKLVIDNIRVVQQGMPDL